CGTNVSWRHRLRFDADAAGGKNTIQRVVWTEKEGCFACVQSSRRALHMRTFEHNLSWILGNGSMHSRQCCRGCAIENHVHLRLQCEHVVLTNIVHAYC